MIASSDVRSILQASRNRTILVVGDVMLDRFVEGQTTRISAEAPVPILSHSKDVSMLGGAANVARNVVTLGGRAALVGLIGDDASGRDVVRLVESDGIISGLCIDGSRPTAQKVRYLGSGQQLLRVDTEEVKPASPGIAEALVDAIARLGAEADAVLLSDYGKGVVVKDVIEACHAMAERWGATFIVDSKAQQFGHYGSVDILKPNAQELARATGLPTETDDEVERAAEAALRNCSAKSLLVTRSAKGLSLARRGQAVQHYALPSPEVVDTAGAGDTALAALGLALSARAAAETAAQFALLASWRVVQKAGVSVATGGELIAESVMAAAPNVGFKLVDRDVAIDVTSYWRSRGLRIGFASGAFDVVNPAHVARIKDASEGCDRLIVGVEDPGSGLRQDGALSPVNALVDRAIVVGGLEVVDLVVAISQDARLDFIEALRPDVVVDDADGPHIAGPQPNVVESRGGVVKVVEHPGEPFTRALAPSSSDAV